jgi:site-specific DNA-methyltransferase (adenine-specific)
LTPIVSHRGRIRLWEADCRDVLRSLPDNSIDSVVTDPPYGLVSVVKRFGKPGSAPAKFGSDGRFARQSAGFMGEQWDNGETAFAAEFWAEVLRVLKPGGHCLAFGGTRTYHRLAVAVEDAGFEIRDQIGWLYGSGFPKSHDVMKAIDKSLGAKSVVTSERETGWSGTLGGKAALGGIGDAPDTRRTFAAATPEAAQWEGWGSAIKPAWEPIVVARKPLEGTLAQNVLKWGVGALNINACRIPTDENLSGGAYSKDGDTGRACDQIFGSEEAAKQNKYRPGGAGEFEQPEGRWPANIVHDGSDEVLEAFPDGGSAARFSYCAKTSTTDRDEGLEDFETVTVQGGGGTETDKADAYGSKKPNRKNVHPTVKPTPLMAWLVRLVTPRGGIVLDPFMGSGSTGKAAMQEGMTFYGVEREAKYMPIAVARISHAAKKADDEAWEALLG